MKDQQESKSFFDINLEHLYFIESDNVNGYYRRLYIKTNTEVKNFCLDDKDKIEYYKNKFRETQHSILNSEIDGFNMHSLVMLELTENEVIMDKESCIRMIRNNSIIPKKYDIFEYFDKILFPNGDDSSSWTAHYKYQSEYERIFGTSIKKILKLSIRLKYYRMCIQEMTTPEKNQFNVKGLKKFDLYQRYLILEKTTNIVSDIMKFNTSQNSKHKLLSILLNCSIDNSKHLLNGTYSKKISFKSTKLDEVDTFIENLKIND